MRSGGGAGEDGRGLGCAGREPLVSRAESSLESEDGRRRPFNLVCTDLTRGTVNDVWVTDPRVSHAMTNGSASERPFTVCTQPPRANAEAEVYGRVDGGPRFVTDFK
jgi:hypothetical protein